MSIKIDSTTDDSSAVTAALGDLAVTTKEVDESASAAKPADETPSESETEEEDEPGETEESEETDEPSKDGEAKPKKNGFKKRIDKLNKRLSERDRELEYWKAQAMKAPAVQETKPEPKNETKSEARPKADDFDSHEDYIEAVADWKLDQREKAQAAKTREDQVKTQVKTQMDSHLERVTAFKKEHSDWDEVMDDVEDVRMSLAVREAILDSENGPALMYELANNREEYERICKLPAIAAARAIGKIESRIEKASETTKETKTTKAPPPPTPVKAKGSGTQKSPDEMDYQEYKRWRAKQTGKA